MSSPDLPIEIDLSASVDIHVPFHDADPAGVAWHGNYFRYFDDARCALLNVIGYSYREMIQDGFYWPIVQTTVKYLKPIPFDARITVAARLVEWDYRLKISYEIYDTRRVLMTKAHTVQVAVAADTGEMHIGAPDGLRSCLHKYLLGVRGQQ